jgi:excisionase family DNA binding protein
LWLNLKNHKEMEVSFETLPKAVTLLANEISEIKRLLLEKNSEQHNQPNQLLTIQQAGEFLNLSVPTLYGYVQRAEIPVSKKGKRLYFSKSELLEWVQEGRKKTVSEIEADAGSNLGKTKKGASHE